MKGKDNPQNGGKMFANELKQQAIHLQNMQTVHMLVVV